MQHIRELIGGNKFLPEELIGRYGRETDICWGPSPKGDRVVSRIFKLPREVGLTSTKKEAFINSSLLFLVSSLFCTDMKQKTKGSDVLWVTSPLHYISSQLLKFSPLPRSCFWRITQLHCTVVMLCFTASRQWFIEKNDCTIFTLCLYWEFPFSVFLKVLWSKQPGRSLKQSL